MSVFQITAFDRASLAGTLKGLVGDALAADFEVAVLYAPETDYVTVIGAHHERGGFTAGFHADGKVNGGAFLRARDPNWRLVPDSRSKLNLVYGPSGRPLRTPSGAEKKNTHRKPDGIGLERFVTDNGSINTTALRAWIKKG